MENFKHAFLIGAYKNPEYIESLINSLDNERSNIYIHINKANYEDFINLKKKYGGKENIFFLSEVLVKWGGSSFLLSVMVLIKKALEDKENHFFHLISGGDILVRPLFDLFDFFDINKEKNFINYDEFPNMHLGKDGGKKRYDYYHAFDILDTRFNLWNWKINAAILILQKTFFLKRSTLPFKKLYVGAPWWSLNRKAVELIKISIDSKILKRLKHTFAPDEIIFQDVLLNSTENLNIENDYLRFISWENSENCGPEILTKNNYDSIINSNVFFARKIEPDRSKELIELIRLYVTSKGIIK